MNGVILTSYFTKQAHPNHIEDKDVVGREANGFVSNDSFSYIEKWYNSLVNLKLNGVIFHDDLSEEFTSKYENEFIKFIKVKDGGGIYSNNDWRFYCFRDYLNESQYDWVFHADVSDVVTVKNPSELLSEYSNYDFYACEDSIKISDFPYLISHNDFGWKQDVDCLFEYDDWMLINMGVVGGSFDNMRLFYNTFCQVREELELRLEADTDGTKNNVNMWICQYLLRWIFKDKKTLIGEPVTSKYKQHENDRKDVWFIHK